MHRGLSQIGKSSARVFSSDIKVKESLQKTIQAARSPSFALRPTSEVLKHYPQTRVTSLPNGMRVASETGAGETATVGVWIDTGSRYEDETNNGVAHFLEHMFFKGTQRRTRAALEEEVENIGGHLNAYTSREQTVLYAKVFKGDIPQAVDLLADVIQNSKFDPENIERERHVILREMHEVDQQMNEVVFDKLHYTAYRDTSLARTILGPKENIQSFTRDDILSYIRQHYTAPRIVIAGAGAVEHEQLVKLAQDLFGKIPTNPPIPVYKEPAAFTGSEIKIRFDEWEEAHCAIAWPVGGWTDSDTYPLMLIQTMLGAYDKYTSPPHTIHTSSPLIGRIMYKDLASSVMPFNTQYSDTGLFGVYAVTGPVTLEDTMSIIQHEITRFSYEVDEIRLHEAKVQLKANLLAHLDGSTQTAEDIGRQLLTYGRRLHPIESIARIDAVDANAIKHCARRFFYDRDHALAAMGPIYGLPYYPLMRQQNYWQWY